MLKTKMSKQEKTFHQEHLALNEDYKRITEQFKELQKKFRHFQIADSKKYREVWVMNEERTKELMRKVLQADRIIHEQQLGLKWTPPSEDLFRSIDPVSLSLSNSNDGGAVSIQANGNTTDADKLGESLAAKFKEHKGHSKTVKRMLELLCNEAGFLVEDKLQKLLAPLHKDEQSLMKLDSIFKALNVETVEDIERLTSFFVDKSHGSDRPISPLETEATPVVSDVEWKEGLSPTMPDGTQIGLIHPNDVVRAIRKFIEEHRNNKLSNPPRPSHEFANTSGNTETGHEYVKGCFYNYFRSNLTPLCHFLDELAESKEIQISAPIEKSKSNVQREYWEKMANVINERNYRIWTVCYQFF
jgi:dynein regulatry complex protein 1